MPDVALQLGRCVRRPLMQRTRRKVLRGQANTSRGTGAACERKAERLVQRDDVFGDGIISCFVLQIVQPHRGIDPHIAGPKWKPLQACSSRTTKNISNRDMIACHINMSAEPALALTGSGQHACVRLTFCFRVLRRSYLSQRVVRMERIGRTDMA